MLTKDINEFKKRNVKLIAIASDTVNLLKKFKEDNNFEIDMISDRGAKIAKDYDVYWFANGYSAMKVKQAVPGTFLIDKDGTIIWKYVGKDKTERSSVRVMTIIIDKYLNNPN